MNIWAFRESLVTPPERYTLNVAVEPALLALRWAFTFNEETRKASQELRYLDRHSRRPRRPTCKPSRQVSVVLCVSSKSASVLNVLAMARGESVGKPPVSTVPVRNGVETLSVGKPI